MNQLPDSNAKPLKRRISPILIILVVFVSVTLAYVLGSLAAEWYYNNKRAQQADDLRETVLAKIEHLKPGFVMPDWRLETLEFELTQLSDHIGARTVLAFIEPGCESCMDEMEQLGKTLSDSASFARILFVSAGNPRELMDIGHTYGLHSTILYDHERAFCSQLGILIYPFHLVVDSELVVSQVIRGRLGEENIERLLLQ